MKQTQTSREKWLLTVLGTTLAIHRSDWLCQQGGGGVAGMDGYRELRCSFAFSSQLC
jgi:hypothetical protein